MARKTIGRGVTALAVALVLATSGALANDPNEIAGRELTLLFRSARAVISAEQEKINNPDLGDKGLSGDAVVNAALANYEKSAGAKLDMSTNVEAKQAMLAAIKSVMTSSQTLINEKGKGFKGFLPAVFARRVATEFSTAMAGKMVIKLTAPSDIVRNRANRPDEWESEKIDKFFRQASWEKGKAIAELAQHKGKPAYRVILPEYYGPSCLACHGEPKGELDITGGKKEGLKEGDLGGAVSFVIYQ